MNLACIVRNPDRVLTGECLGEIPRERALKGKVTCCEACQRLYRRYKRSLKAEVDCRLCGRRIVKEGDRCPTCGRKRRHKPVLSEHNSIQEGLG